MSHSGRFATGTAPVGTERGLVLVAILLGAQHTVITNQQCLAGTQHAKRLGWRALVPSIHQVCPDALRSNHLSMFPVGDVYLQELRLTTITGFDITNTLDTGTDSEPRSGEGGGPRMHEAHSARSNYGEETTTRTNAWALLCVAVGVAGYVVVTKRLKKDTHVESPSEELEPML